MRTLKRERVKIALRTSASDKHFTSVQNPCIYVGMCRNSYQNVYQMFIRSFAPQHKIVAAFGNFFMLGGSKKRGKGGERRGDREREKEEKRGEREEERGGRR